MASGASSGVAPGGSSATPARCETTVRATKLLVSSENVSVISDSPNRLSLRMRVMPGVPLSSRSRGTVMRRSISSGALPGSWVITVTWVLVTSGYASIGVSK